MPIGQPALRLVKYQILGNSYLLLPPDRNPGLAAWAAGWPWDGDGQPGLAPALVRRLCAADRGIGSEGLILGPLHRPGRSTALHIYNQDGTRCNFSGNAIRMVTRYLADTGTVSGAPGTALALGVIGTGPASAGSPTVETEAETRIAGPGGREIAARLPAPRIGRRHVAAAPDQVHDRAPPPDAPPVAGAWSAVPALSALPGPVDTVGSWGDACFVEVGNPHCVAFVDDPARLPSVGFGEIDAAALRALSYAGPSKTHPALGAVFPEGCNLQFVHAEADGTRLTLRTFERGGGPTAASGSSSSAAAVAAYARGRTGPRVAVAMPGGTITIALDGPPTAIAGIALKSAVTPVAEIAVPAEALADLDAPSPASP